MSEIIINIIIGLSILRVCENLLFGEPCEIERGRVRKDSDSLISTFGTKEAKVDSFFPDVTLKRGNREQ